MPAQVRAPEGVMQTQLGLGGLTPGVASACPLPARLRLSPVSTRKSERAPLSSWSIVCGAHGREPDAWWSISCLIVLNPGVVRRGLGGRTGGVCAKFVATRFSRPARRDLAKIATREHSAVVSVACLLGFR